MKGIPNIVWLVVIILVVLFIAFKTPVGSLIGLPGAPSDFGGLIPGMTPQPRGE